MQAKPRVWPALVAVLLLSLVLAACGGGDSGKSWFNLPSAKLDIAPNGAASFYGLPVPAALLAAPQVEQLQEAGAQRVEARWGYDGVNAQLNGEDLPGLAWDAESEQTLSDLVQQANLPNGGLIARALPWLRTVGSGVRLELPPVQGEQKMDIPRWDGTVNLAADAVDTPTIGPIEISNINVDDAGNLRVGPVPVSALAPGVAIPPSLMNTLQALGVTKLVIDTQPDGLHITLNDRKLPRLAYNAASLQLAVDLINKVNPNPELAGTLNQVAALLPAADINVGVNFTGETSDGQLALDNLRVKINEDGTVEALGVPLPVGSILPAALLGQLRETGLSNLKVDVGRDGLRLANAGQPLPAITWNESGIGLIRNIAPALGVSGDQVGAIFDILSTTDLSLDVALPGAEADAAPVETAAFAPVDLGDFKAPIIRAALQLDADGKLTRVGNLDFGDLAAMGLPASVALPANVVDILKRTGAKQVGLVGNGQGHVDITLDGAPALALDFDTNSLRSLLATVKPLANVELLNDPNISKLIDEQILPLVPGSQIDIQISLP